MASGDVVNTAARLQTAAPVNGILAGETTYRATQHAIEYRDAPPVDAKGKSKPVRAWEVVVARSRYGLDVEQQVRAPLVGRESEREQLTSALRRAREERAPQLVTLVGVPGIGKSRLVAELFQVVDSDPDLIAWRQGRSLPYGETLSFWALAEIVKSQVGILETDSIEAAEAKLQAAVQSAISDSRDADWIERYLRPLVGLESALGETGDRRTESFAAWRRFLEAVADRGPLVLIFEDLHWADDGLLDFVDHLADWTSGVALLLVCTARPELLERRPGWGGGKRNAATVSVSALGEAETAQLLGNLLEQALLPAEIQAEVLRRTEGNPLFAEEYVRMLQDRGFLVRGNGGWRLERSDDLPLPETVQGLIAARLDALAPEEKALVQDAAVLGKVFWSSALAAIGGEAPFVLEERLHALERKEFVRRERRSAVAGEVQHAFLHLLLRDVAYGQIPRQDRAAKHQRAADWIESLSADRSEDRAEMLAHHYLEALELAQATGVDDTALVARAGPALFEAGERALSLSAFQTAADYFSRGAVLLPEDDARRPQLLFDFLRARSLLGSFDHGLAEEARTAALSLGQPEFAAKAAALEGTAFWVEGKQERANELLAEAVAMLVDAPASHTKVWVQAQQAARLCIGGNVAKGLPLAEEVLGTAQALGADDVVADALRVIGTVRSSHGDENALAPIERSLEISERLNEPELIHLSANNLANMHWHFGRLDEGARYLAFDLEIQQRFGMPPNSPGMRWLAGEKVLELEMRGAWNEALRKAEQLIEDIGAERFYLLGVCHLHAGQIQLALGDISRALESTELGLELAREVKDPQQLLPALMGRARTLLAVGRRDEANELLDELFSTRELLIGEYWFRELAWTMLEAGREAEYLDAAERGASTPWLEAGVAVAKRDFATAAEIYGQIGAKGAEAVARLHASEALATVGRRAEAHEALEAVQAFFRAEGATPYLRRCEVLLAAAS
jgi:hypothetical protein